MASSIDAISANLVLIIGVMKSSITAESIITIVVVALNTSSTIVVSFGIKSTGAFIIISSIVAVSSRTVMPITVMSSFADIESLMVLLNTITAAAELII